MWLPSQSYVNHCNCQTNRTLKTDSNLFSRIISASLLKLRIKYESKWLPLPYYIMYYNHIVNFSQHLKQLLIIRCNENLERYMYITFINKMPINFLMKGNLREVRMIYMLTINTTMTTMSHWLNIYQIDYWNNTD